MSDKKSHLLDIFYKLGQRHIDSLQADELDMEPEGGRQEVWEQQLGVRLAIRIVEQTMVSLVRGYSECLSEAEDKRKTIQQLSGEKKALLNENARLKKGRQHSHHLKGRKRRRVEPSDDDDGGSQKTIDVFEESDAPPADVSSDLSQVLESTPGYQSSRAFASKKHQGESNDEAILSGCTPANRVLVPETVPDLAGCSRNLLETQAVPDTPEKKQEDNDRPKYLSRPAGEISPVLKRNTGSKFVKLRLLSRSKMAAADKEIKKPNKSSPAEQQALEKSKSSHEQAEDNKAGRGKENLRAKKVGTVSAKEQVVLDRKAWVDLDNDFVVNKRTKANKKNNQADLQDSPSLLDRQASVMSLDVCDGKSNDIEDFITQKEPPNVDPDVLKEPQQNIVKKQGQKEDTGKGRAGAKKVKAENRWGIVVSEVTESAKKRLKSQKQSTLDGFFGSNAGSAKRPPRSKENSFQQELLEAKKRSLATFEKEATRSREPSGGDDDDSLGDGEPAAGAPAYAYVNDPVRKVDERKKLAGFDCPECKEYYQAKREMGYTDEEVKRFMNKCSRHRAAYKPPVTPEKFWDIDIVDGDPNSPRNKTQRASPLRSRAQRRTESRYKNKILVMKPPVYLDYNATTPLAPEVIQAISDSLSLWGNPSSGYETGQRAAQAVVKARRQVSDMIGATPEEITFTSGGTEANHLAMWSAIANAKKNSKLNDLPHVVTLNIEHCAISLPLKHWEEEGHCTVTWVPVVKGVGRASVQDVLSAVQPSTCLVTIMLANNETGAIQPVEQIFSELRSKANRPLLHTDAAQAIGKIKVDVNELGADFLTIVGHKFYGPKIGALYHHKLTGVVHPMFYGGGQESGLRPGTENVPMIAGLGVACELVTQHLTAYNEHFSKTRNYLQEQLMRKFTLVLSDAALKAGEICWRHVEVFLLPNTLSIRFGGFTGPQLLAACKDHLEASTGAACHTGSGVSQVLLNSQVCGVEGARETVRLSVGRDTSHEDIDRVVSALADVVLAAQ